MVSGAAAGLNHLGDRHAGTGFSFLKVPVDLAGNRIRIAKDLVDQLIERLLLIGGHLNVDAVLRSERQHLFVGVGLVEHLNVVVHLWAEATSAVESRAESNAEAPT